MISENVNNDNYIRDFLCFFYTYDNYPVWLEESNDGCTNCQALHHWNRLEIETRLVETKLFKEDLHTQHCS